MKKLEHYSLLVRVQNKYFLKGFKTLCGALKPMCSLETTKYAHWNVQNMYITCNHLHTGIYKTETLAWLAASKIIQMISINLSFMPF